MRVRKDDKIAMEVVGYLCCLGGLCAVKSQHKCDGAKEGRGSYKGMAILLWAKRVVLAKYKTLHEEEKKFQ